jgi:hypothetical protein
LAHFLLFPLAGVLWRAWPLSTNDLRLALGDVFDDVTLVWHDSEFASPTVSARWAPDWERRSRSHFSDDTSIAIWIYGVADKVAAETGQTLRQVVLAELAQWVQQADRADEEWQGRGHSKDWLVENGNVTTRVHDAARRRRR